jgi:hypothetical protein
MLHELFPAPSFTNISLIKALDFTVRIIANDNEIPLKDTKISGSGYSRFYFEWIHGNSIIEEINRIIY